MSEYILDNAWQHARQRLARLEAQFDPSTMRHLTALGLDAGWNCLEVGAGGGSIAAWLCERVGPSGRVVATDIDTRFLTALAPPSSRDASTTSPVTRYQGRPSTWSIRRTVLNHLVARAAIRDTLVSRAHEPLVDAALLTHAEIDSFLMQLADSSFAWLGMTLVSAWSLTPLAQGCAADMPLSQMASHVERGRVTVGHRSLHGA